MLFRSRGTERPESSTQTGSNKKTAQQRAALALCCRLLGIPHPTATYPAATPMVSSEARPAPPKVTRPEKRRIEAFRHAREMTEPGDWVSALWNVLTAYSLKKPRIVNRPVHSEGATNVHCKMTVTWAGQTLEADATAPTGTQAKPQTAREILEGLLRLQDAEIEPSVSPVNQASTS